MKRILIVGAGRIGTAIAANLVRSRGYAVMLADQSPPQRLPVGATFLTLDASDPAQLDSACRGQAAVISAAPFFLNAGIARAARDADAHYFDLTEDVATTKAIRAIAEGANTAFVPQCGLAPGFVGIVAGDLAKRFDATRAVKMRVGALPRYPANRLKYNLTWSTDGLINEYCNPCEALREGRLVSLQPLEGLEPLMIDGVEYEAFNTSGGLGTLCETLAGKVDSVDYKTIRYPGHCETLKLLLEDLGLSRKRGVLKEIFEAALPETPQDVVHILVTASGLRGGHLVQETFSRIILGLGPDETAIQRTTAAGACVLLDLVLAGRVSSRGFVRQEDVPLDVFLANRFAGVYGETLRAAA
ncbi:MAG TPA: saccharopine dehydrogenase C-terminal domain-containing protein [Alphaproteobacteria bacterium]|nr:saccharopine dehydrogenase C-terminal domain-containing protein [Alphaproteobacteria bacterium]